MKNNTQQLLKTSLLTTLAILSTSVEALEKPKTMEDMWKIIQEQQKQIDTLKAKKEVAPAKTEGSSVKSEATGDVKKLEQKTDILSQEIEKLRTNLSIPDEAKYKSAYGLGPAASKVYQVGKGLSLGGYGEASYRGIVDDKGSNSNSADMYRMVLYAGYKFTDNILFNSEIEFEHGTTGQYDSKGKNVGSVSVEFAALDFFFDPMANIRAGLVLMPMGFINQIHEPPFYFGNNRPEVERTIIPSTWRELGLGLFGQITPDLTYTTYAVNGLDAKNFTSKGIRDSRQSGAKVKAESFGFVGRMDYTPSQVPGLSVGGSAYVGEAGQGQSFAGKEVDVFTQLYEGHVQWKYRGLELRALGSWGHIGDAELLSKDKGETIGSQNFGWYAEAGYDVMPLLFSDTTQYLAPFFRYERFDTIAKAPTGYADDLTKDKEIYQFGVNYKPIPNVVIKADYRNFSNKAGTPEPDEFNLGLGFIF
jgi:hypothetical protein